MIEYIVDIEASLDYEIRLDALEPGEEIPVTEILHERIVRCRDCMHYEPGIYMHFECVEHQISVNEGDFCSFGVMRNEA